MFTGLIEAIGTLTQREQRGANQRLTIDHPQWNESLSSGESIAVNGVCLTVCDFDTGWLAADVSAETLRCSTLGALNQGTQVNLERALKLGARLGGHWVTGHVDGIGEVIQSDTRGDNRVIRIQLERKLAQYVAVKGSISVDGVSLTVNQLDNARFSVNLVPHTLASTSLAELKAGDEVNLEIDMIARYLHRLLERDDQSNMN